MPKPIDRAYSRYAREAMSLLGKTIRIARLERKLTTSELAIRAGISRSLLQRIEQGDPGTSLGAVFETATIVGVPLFEAEPSRLAMHSAHADAKLALLPQAARARRRAVKDAF
jgi:transcriptional regulator with XRE-family HTH domain